MAIPHREGEGLDVPSPKPTSLRASSGRHSAFAGSPVTFSTMVTHMRGWYRKTGFRARKALISLKWGKIGPMLLLKTIRSDSCFKVAVSRRLGKQGRKGGKVSGREVDSDAQLEQGRRLVKVDPMVGLGLGQRLGLVYSKLRGILPAALTVFLPVIQ